MIESNERVEKLLSLILLQAMKDDSQKKKIEVLNKSGFSNVEIADILETSSSVVAKELSINRSKKKFKGK